MGAVVARRLVTRPDGLAPSAMLPPSLCSDQPEPFRYMMWTAPSLPRK